MSLPADVTALADRWTDADGDTAYRPDAGGTLRPVGLLTLLAEHLEPAKFAECYTKSRITGGPAPWDDPVASWWMDVHAGARTFEVALLWTLAAVVRPRRPGSDGHTAAALHRLPGLVRAAESRPDGAELAAEVEVSVGRWRRSGEHLLGASRPAVRLRHRSRVQVTGADGQPVWVNQERTVVCVYCKEPVVVKPDQSFYGDPERWDAGLDWRHDQREPAGVIQCVNDGCRCPAVDAGCGCGRGRRHEWPADARLGSLLLAAEAEAAGVG